MHAQRARAAGAKYENCVHAENLACWVCSHASARMQIFSSKFGHSEFLRAQIFVLPWAITNLDSIIN